MHQPCTNCRIGVTHNWLTFSLWRWGGLVTSGLDVIGRVYVHLSAYVRGVQRLACLSGGKLGWVNGFFLRSVRAGPVVDIGLDIRWGSSCNIRPICVNSGSVKVACMVAMLTRLYSVSCVRMLV